MDAQLKNDILETIKKVVTLFTVQYSKAYLLALVRLIKLESKKETIDWHLETRPVCCHHITFIYMYILIYLLA